uniref:Uncharacterized protein n=1 Tax=Chromera velia CCMP2878 TaxID=1169474 RepID=A0A0G4F268_9ALVE|eukprot:Cvel_14621.t1-p1 / transcript=Cvel_14621.t1 / gene=Cvel_14621 / organism=Chromera_velia_CCMP2878 / gene_product=hypothetical protein / transcript_product=hypothetical protein / location=Cvel_scaffold1046:17540-19462(-) / protein_length=442 / sequence_SO=supercontig / SO=protein_coding / is_pseudo=false
MSIQLIRPQSPKKSKVENARRELQSFESSSMPFDNTPLSPRVAPSIGFTLLHSGASSCDFVGGPGGKDGIVSFAHLGPDCKTAMVCLKEPGKPVRRPPRIPADPAKTFQVTGGGGIRKESGAVKEKVEVCWTRGTDERAEQKEMEEGKNGKEGRRKAGEEAKDEEKETKTKKSLSWEWMEPNRTKNRSLGAQENGNKSIGGHPEKAENKTGKGAEDEAKTNPKDSQKETHKTKITGKGDQTSTQNEADSPANSPARKKHRVKPQPSKEYSGDNLEDASPRSSKGKSSQSPEHRLQQTADTKHKEKIARTTTPHFPVPEPKLLSGAPVLTQTLAEYAVDLDAECAALMPSVTTRASSAMTNSFSPAGSVTREHEGLSLTSLMQKDADRAYQQNSSSTLPPPRIFTCPPTASVRLMQKRLSGLIPIRRGSDVVSFLNRMQTYIG